MSRKAEIQTYILTALAVLVLLFILYAGLASMVFRFRHPHMTETQVLLHMGDALRFRRLPPPSR